MSWMSEIDIMIQEAASAGVELTLSDFSRSDDRLLVRGMTTDEWYRRLADCTAAIDEELAA